MNTYKMNKTLRDAHEGREVSTEDFFGALEEKRKRTTARKETYKKLLRRGVIQQKEMDDMKEAYSKLKTKFK